MPAAMLVMVEIAATRSPRNRARITSGTVDIPTGEAAAAVAERSDVTAVPAMGVIAEAMIAFVLAQAWLEKFGGDSLGETRRNVEGYLAQVAQRVGSGRLAEAAAPDERSAEGSAAGRE